MRRWRWACWTAAVSLMTAWVGVSVADTASAEPERRGDLVITPASGSLDIPIDIVTEGECTRGTTLVVVVEGDGLAEDRGNLVGATKLESLGVPRYPGHYVVPVATPLREYLLRSLSRARLAGDYEIVLVCRNTLDTEPLQTFTGGIRVKEDGSYAAIGSAGREVRDVVGSRAFDLAEEADRLSREAEIAATEPVTGSGDIGEGEDVGVPQGESEPSSWWRPALVVVGAALVLLAVISWARAKGRAEGRLEAKAEHSQESADSST